MAGCITKDKVGFEYGRNVATSYIQRMKQEINHYYDKGRGISA